MSAETFYQLIRTVAVHQENLAEDVLRRNSSGTTSSLLAVISQVDCACEIDLILSEVAVDVDTPD